MKRFYWMYYFCCVFLFCNSTILLYDTKNKDKTLAYDCIYYDGGGETFKNHLGSSQSIKYCVRPTLFVPVQRNYSHGCLNGGTVISFDTLKHINISAQELLQWNSGISVIDRYQSYLANHQLEMNEKTEDFICNCTNSRTFGVLCEYKFLETSFEETVVTQYAKKLRYPLGSQLFGSTTCYQTSFTCDYGKICLDWRNICDGNQQCVDGTDEEHCEELLFNECNPETEYRCRNGMCIDEEYFLDGDIDCQDQSDEQYHSIYAIVTLCFAQFKLDCDEKILESKQQISCGDGSYIYTQQHYRQVSGTAAAATCYSYRDRQWKCELNDKEIMWTNADNGHCLDYVDNTTDVVKEEIDCVFIHKCALTKPGQHHLCPCTGNACRAYFSRYCHSTNVSLFAYPPGRIFTQFVETYYKSDIHDFDRNRWPDVFIFTRSIKCSHQLRVVPNDWLYNESVILRAVKGNILHPLEILLCEKYTSLNVNQTNYGNCWNDSYLDRGRRCRNVIPYDCISKYHVKDGIYDCTPSKDEKEKDWFEDCSSIRKHRFRCSQSEQTCLTIMALGNNRVDCKTNSDDEYSSNYNLELRNVKCTDRDSVDCIFLRQYIAESPILDTNINETTNDSIKFWNYCDSSWEKNYGGDEIDCHEWKCPLHYTFQQFYQCRTGQCIPQKWLCNGEWDCSDGSDEEAIQLLTEQTISKHNLKLFQLLGTNLAEQKNRCLKANSELSFRQFCNVESEYPCLLANVDDPLNFRLNRPCINLTQLGDGYVDCLGGLDERNILNCSSRQQLGFGFKCHFNDRCIARRQQCTTNHRCLNGNDRLFCFYLSNNSYVNCNGQHSSGIVEDVHCLNGTCLPNARCNGIAECPFGEEEYYCPTGRSTRSSNYRPIITKSAVSPIKIELPNYFQFSFQGNQSDENTEEKKKVVIPNQSPSKVLSRQETATLYSKEGWICNRGVAAIQNSFDVQCFCPPSYYGDRCQFMSDRLTIFLTFENQINSTLEGVIKILALLVVTINNTEAVLDHHQVHFTSELDNFQEKQKFYLVYLRPHELRSKTHRYTIRFEAYQLNANDTIEFLATWIYSVPFNFLPSQRLAKVLKYIHPAQLSSNHTCLSNLNPCLNGGKCHPIMNQFNDIHSYWCLCPNSSYGSHCQFRDQSCSIKPFFSSNYCSPTSLCRPKYDDYGQKPLCICSMNSYGPHCFIPRSCQMKIGLNPCQHGGTCITRYQYDKLINDYTCKCPKFYYGSVCQYRSGSIQIDSESENGSFTLFGDEIRATVIQLFDISNREELILKKQIVYKDSLPAHVTISSEDRINPLFGLIKFYTNRSTIDYHLLYTNSTNQSSLNLTLRLTKENYCSHTHDIFNLRDEKNQSIFSLKVSNVVSKYHTLCEKGALCFVDDDYLCLCDVNEIAQCYLNYRQFDQCKQCLVGGQCIKGDIDTASDYLCLCPQCHFGSTCQHNTKLFSYTLETLISFDLVSSSLTKRRVSLSMYIIVPAVLFMYGAISNLFTLVTFQRPKTRLNGTGYYLYIGTLFSQLSLFCLLSKTVHIIINIRGLSIHPIVNIVLCKIFSFLLSSSTRISYWLIIFVAIERMYVAVYAVKRWLNQPKIAKKIIIIIILLTLASHLHESIEYIIVDDPKYTLNGKWCVTQFIHPLQVYNQVNTMIHYITPFLVNLICTIILLITIARSRANLDKKKSRWEIFKQEFRKKKEMFIPSLTIIISALPHLIISFSLGCTDLDTKWQRYLLIISYFFAYVPQTLNFHLYVQPSKLFLQEFHATKVWKTLRRRFSAKKGRP